MIPRFEDTSNAFAHITLVVASVWSYGYFDDSLSFIRIATNLNLVLGLVGVIGSLLARYGSPERVDSVKEWYSSLLNINFLLILPCIVAATYQAYHYVIELAALHVLAAVVPFFNRSAGYRDGYIFANLCSLAFLATRRGNYYALSVVPVYAIDYYVVAVRERVMELAAGDVFVMLLAICQYLGIKALTPCR